MTLEEKLYLLLEQQPIEDDDMEVNDDIDSSNN